MERTNRSAAGRSPAENAPDGKKGLRVLVVDDDTDSAESMALLLRMYGHEVRIAASGIEALAAFRRQQPDVVLLDILLPGMNGFEVARRLQEEPRDKRPLFLAVTGYQEEADRHSTADSAFDLHLLKPVNPQDLQRVLSRFQDLIQTVG